MSFRFYAPPVKVADLDVGTGEDNGDASIAITMHGASHSMAAHLSRDEAFLLASVLVDQLDWFEPIAF